MRIFQSFFRRQCTAAVLAALLIAPGTAAAQQPEQAKPAPETKPPKTEPMGALPIVENLKIFVLAGEGEMNDMERRVMAPVVVEVRDQNDRPVESAEVTFRFPPSGPSAYFPGPKLAQTVRTNMQGQAAATGWTANGQPGPLRISATALYGNQMGKAAISMTNVTRITDEMLKEQKKERHWWQSWKWWTVILAGAAGAGVGIYYGVRDSGPAPVATPTVTISPGGVVIGGR